MLTSSAVRVAIAFLLQHATHSEYSIVWQWVCCATTQTLRRDYRDRRLPDFFSGVFQKVDPAAAIVGVWELPNGNTATFDKEGTVVFIDAKRSRQSFKYRHKSGSTFVILAGTKEIPARLANNKLTLTLSDGKPAVLSRSTRSTQVGSNRSAATPTPGSGALETAAGLVVIGRAALLFLGALKSLAGRGRSDTDDGARAIAVWL